LEVGVDSLPTLPRHASDRNRTSPFAFTGAKFEFRAVGSNASLAGPNVVINTIVTEALDEICTQLEADKKAKKDLNKAVQKILQDIIKKHKRVIFNGDNYTEGWLKEAKKRGLPNLKTTPEALAAMRDPKAAKLFEKYKVLSKKELASRNEVYTETYETIIQYEANLMVDMARTMIIPVGLEYADGLAAMIKSVEGINKTKVTGTRKLLAQVTALTETAISEATILEAAAKASSTTKTRASMAKLRKAVVTLEGLVPAETWPLPSYAEMLFIQ
jgi:glutamine synthetase